MSTNQQAGAGAEVVIQLARAPAMQTGTTEKELLEPQKVISMVGGFLQDSSSIRIGTVLLRCAMSSAICIRFMRVRSSIRREQWKAAVHAQLHGWR